VRRALLFALLALAACQQRDDAAGQRIAALENRVTAIEKAERERTISHIVDLGRQADRVQQERTRAAAQAAPRFELIGLEGGRRTYPNAARCEAALRAVQQGWDEANARLTQRGGYVINPAVSCVPM
jgi:hypothetical protein